MTARPLVLLLSAVAALALAPAAQAAKVKGPQPWAASSTYLVEADLDGRAAPQLDPVAKVDHLRKGQWVAIECQVAGQEAYGSKLWDRVGGLYVPDHFIKTYTDGGLQGVPRCSDHDPAATPSPAPAPTPAPQPAGPTRAQLAAAVRAVAFERVYGSNWARYEALYPDAIDWDHNGCSVPEQLIALHIGRFPIGKGVGFYADLFEKSCNRHDFGYRNYGTHEKDGLHLDPTAARRKAIDNRFHSNMDYQCDRAFSHKYLEAVQRAACHKAADVFHQAVSHFARDRFF